MALVRHGHSWASASRSMLPSLSFWHPVSQSSTGLGPFFFSSGTGLVPALAFLFIPVPDSPTFRHLNKVNTLHNCTSILLAEERDTPFTFKLLAVEGDTPSTSILLAVERHTPCTVHTACPHCRLWKWRHPARANCCWWKGRHPARPYCCQWKEMHPACPFCWLWQWIHSVR